MKLLLQNNYLEKFSTHNEEKFVVEERLIRTLKIYLLKIYKYMTSFKVLITMSK